MKTKIEHLRERAPVEDQTATKLFDNYGPVDARETIGTFFLGVLAICLFLALQRSWSRYETLLERTSGLSKEV